ncbi:hypothetical protein KFE25_014424 [Diacronema lutheri]|uniref:Uncharacterized protein n=1 Tax=Diacronema lutheri TaxID=2081491 RepID=A0A8J6C680_DIALT|nr:hypothetical protein KFE25_014424 [Diacronema lutheri]
MRGREIDVQRSLTFEARVRAEKRAEALAADATAHGFVSTGGIPGALPGSGALARALARNANDALAGRWHGTAYAPGAAALAQRGDFAFRGALQRPLLPAVSAQPSAPLPAEQEQLTSGAVTASTLGWRPPRGPSPLTGYSSTSLAQSQPALAPLRPPPAPFGTGAPGAAVPLSAFQPQAHGLPDVRAARSLALGSRAARHEREAAEAFALAERTLAAYDQRAAAVRRRAAQMPLLDSSARGR